MYSVLSGKTEHLLPLCETWEDVMWAHTNACLQDTIDQWEGSSVPSRHLQGDAPCLFMAESARQKDMLLDSSDPIIFFHWVQEAFLMNTLSNVIDLLYQVCVQGQWDKVGCVRENPSLHRTFLRFAAGVVLYARSHLSETSEKGDLLLVFYARSIGTSSLEVSHTAEKECAYNSNKRVWSTMPLFSHQSIKA
ncbi:hypothetical protein BDF14DRAFT_509269 [Spinellus fusiger]|nr:hypothetical protein BDF14DRAFT_509269 [Spinellus fusiger]